MSTGVRPPALAAAASFSSRASAQRAAENVKARAGGADVVVEE